MREEDAGGREAGAHSTTSTYAVRRDSPASEPSWSAFLLVSETIHRDCTDWRRERGLFIERTTPQAPTKPNTRKPARLAIV